MNKLQWNFNRNTKLFIHENAAENIVCEITQLFCPWGDELNKWQEFRIETFLLCLQMEILENMQTVCITFQIIMTAKTDTAKTFGTFQSRDGFWPDFVAIINLLHAKFFRGNISILLFSFYVIAPHWHGPGSLNHSSSKTTTFLFHICNITAASRDIAYVE